MNLPIRFFAAAALMGFSSCVSVNHAADTSIAAGGSAGWEILFDGTGLEKWRGFKRDSFPDKGWKAENGLLKTIPGGDVVDVVTKDSYDNFELSLEWKVSPGANSGVLYRVSEGFDESWYSGPEMQVLDDDKHPDGKNPKTSAGALYALIAPANKYLKPVGEFNSVRIFVNGNHVEHWLNGEKVVEYELGSESLQQLVKESKFKDMPKFAQEKSGHIALQHHHDEVWYRNVTIRRIGFAKNEK